MEEDYLDEIEPLKKKLAQATFHPKPTTVHAYPLQTRQETMQTRTQAQPPYDKQP